MAADRAALAVQSLRSREDQAAALALQRSLVPSALPAVRGTEVAARYVPGSGRVGGDWYDVFVLPSGELGMVVGDVAGSGLGAAVIMGRIRSAPRAYALEFPGPADVLVKLDQKMQYFEEGDVMATVSYAVLDPGSGQLRLIGGSFPGGYRGPRPARRPGPDRRRPAHRRHRCLSPAGHHAGLAARYRAVHVHRWAGGTPVRADR